MEHAPKAVQTLRSALEAVDELDLLSTTADLDRFSRDAYDYSPVLEEQFGSCRAQLVVRPHTVAAVMAVLVPGCIGHSCNVPWQGTGRTSVRCGRVCHAFPGGRPHTARGQTCPLNFHCKHSRAAPGAWSYHALTFPLSTRPLKKESSDASSSTLPPSPCKRPSGWSCPP